MLVWFLTDCGFSTVCLLFCNICLSVSVFGYVHSQTRCEPDWVPAWGLSVYWMLRDSLVKVHCVLTQGTCLHSRARGRMRGASSCQLYPAHEDHLRIFQLFHVFVSE